jgi:hypothetical protein
MKQRKGGAIRIGVGSGFQMIESMRRAALTSSLKNS